MAKGLQKGARLLRRWRRFSNLRLVHPVKFCVVVLLLVPNLAIILSLYYLGRFGNWLSRGENAGERYAAWWGRWSEPDREHELRIRAWLGRAQEGRCVVKWPKEHPGPWKYDPDEDAEITDMPILDANGDPVVQTDSGCYPPDPETARMIVDAMNGREEVRAAMNAILATIAISDQGFMTKENALQVVENMVRDALKKLKRTSRKEATMPSAEPSPRPWRVKQSPIGSNAWIVSGETFVASVSCAADAALIVDAVNERESLFADMKVKETEMRLKIDAAEKERTEACIMRGRAKEWHSVWLKENEKLRDKLDASEAERGRLRDIVRRFIDQFTPGTIHPAGTMERLLREARAELAEKADAEAAEGESHA